MQTRSRSREGARRLRNVPRNRVSFGKMGVGQLAPILARD